MNKLRIIVLIIAIVVTANLVITTGIDRFVNPNMSETRLFQRIPRTFFWNF